MCGFAGYFQFQQQEIDPALIGRMTHAMRHRGPDAEGVYQKGRIAFGHRRLSIIDLSEKSNQPFHDGSGRYTIIFNGEIYNYQEVKNELSGYSFKTSGDTEVVLAAMIQWGPAALSKLKGMFAFALWDEQTQRLLIARDRLGVKPLYYSVSDTGVVFGSEIRSLLASGKVKPVMNRKALWDYLAFQSFQSPDTLIEGVQELEAGHYIHFDNGPALSTCWWKLEDAPAVSFDGDYAAACKQLRSLLLQSVERRMISDVPVAAFLSGGIDSSAVVALMAEVAEKPETFNVYFEEKAFDESAFAGIIAKKYQTRHHSLLIKPTRFLDELPEALDKMDTPSGDGVNTYVVSKAIKAQGIKVALSGVGGDELFAGYPIFRQWQKMNRFKFFWSLPAGLRKAGAALLSGPDMRKQRMAELLTLPRLSLSTAYPLLRQLNSNRTLSTLLHRSVITSQLQNSLQQREPDLSAYPLLSQLTAAEYIGYTRQTLLKDTDQMSMAVSLEVREPFFDHELIEFIMGIPDGFKQRGNKPKSFLLDALGPMIPEEIYNRPKQGFVFPWKNWFRLELQEFCSQKINALAARDAFAANAVQQIWQDFSNERNSVTPTHIMQLVVLEHYLEKHGIS